MIDHDDAPAPKQAFTLDAMLNRDNSVSRLGKSLYAICKMAATTRPGTKVMVTPHIMSMIRGNDDLRELTSHLQMVELRDSGPPRMIPRPSFEDLWLEPDDIAKAGLVIADEFWRQRGEAIARNDAAGVPRRTLYRIAREFSEPDAAIRRP